MMDHPHIVKVIRDKALSITDQMPKVTPPPEPRYGSSLGWDPMRDRRIEKQVAKRRRRNRIARLSRRRNRR